MFKVFTDKIRYNFDIFKVETGKKIIETAKEYNLIHKVEITKPVAHTKTADSLFKPLRKKVRISRWCVHYFLISKFPKINIGYWSI